MCLCMKFLFVIWLVKTTRWFNKLYFVLFSTVLLDFNPCNIRIPIFVALVMTFSISPVIGIVLLNLCVLLSRGTKSYFVLTL